MAKTKSTAETISKFIKEDKFEDSSDNDENSEAKLKNYLDSEEQKKLDTIFEIGEENKDEEIEFSKTHQIYHPTKRLCLNKSSRIFEPSSSKNKNEGFEVDEKGLLRITGFDDSLNLKFTNQLSELFRKTSMRFKVSPKMDTTTYIKTLHNMYLQHYNKHLKQTGEFNEETSAIIFPQIIKFM